MRHILEAVTGWTLIRESIRQGEGARINLTLHLWKGPTIASS